MKMDTVYNAETVTNNASHNNRMVVQTKIPLQQKCYCYLRDTPYL